MSQVILKKTKKSEILYIYIRDSLDSIKPFTKTDRQQHLPSPPEVLDPSIQSACDISHTSCEATFIPC